MSPPCLIYLSTSTTPRGGFVKSIMRDIHVVSRWSPSPGCCGFRCVVLLGRIPFSFSSFLFLGPRGLLTVSCRLASSTSLIVRCFTILGSAFFASTGRYLSIGALQYYVLQCGYTPCPARARVVIVYILVPVRVHIYLLYKDRAAPPIGGPALDDSGVKTVQWREREGHDSYREVEVYIYIYVCGKYSS